MGELATVWHTAQGALSCKPLSLALGSDELENHAAQQYGNGGAAANQGRDRADMMLGDIPGRSKKVGER